MTGTKIRRSSNEDYSAVVSLLKSASLPVEGVAEHFPDFLVAENGNEIVGAIGLEIYGETALLRSAVVHPSHQKKGLGTRLYDELLELSKSNNVHRLILLTNTAQTFFSARGFRKIDATRVSGPITRSAEFTGACPSTAACMELSLNPESRKRDEGSQRSLVAESVRDSAPSRSATHNWRKV